ncbi:hypothetical protein EZS27_020233 [termite gut metagenome]|uniref:Transposase IS116/IS110/IS902 C-terminal domain-containing protein n=1 Tax=termite gut metagenome TaxID=433724 RepID=A0A5J4RD92_9ZZZZ
MLCQTNGFLLSGNIRQVVSYAGLDVKMSESGHYKGRTRISKQGEHPSEKLSVYARIECRT